MQEFFGSLCIVVGVFALIGGGCATIFGQAGGIFTFVVGLVLIVYGAHLNKSAK